MKVLFVYSVQKSILQEKPLLGQEGIYFGISLIASVLKAHGHSCELVVLDRRYKHKNLKLLSGRIASFQPQIVAFTSVYSEFDFICRMASGIKALHPDLFLYAGGVHITLNPDEKYLEVFDAFCVGEGEYPTLELVDNLQDGKGIDTIPNLWVKTTDGIVKNPPRLFLPELDQLPFPDREMWQEWIFEPDTKLTVLLGRGCPYNCTYCCNHRLRKTATGKYVRMRSPENIIEEIRKLHAMFPKVDEIYLEIETLGADLKWLEAFCEALHRFGEETGHCLRFGTNLRIFPSLDLEQVFRNLKKANITSVTVGLESGSYRIRKEILNRDYSNEIILKAAAAAKQHGVAIALFNMVGLPTETPVEFSETLEMNRKIQPAFHATSIFFPYPGTRLYELCEEMRLIPEAISTKDERQIATLDLPGFSKQQIQRSFDSFHYNVYKARKSKSPVKLLIYYSMQYLGHNFYANLKVRVIRALFRLRAKSNIAYKHAKFFRSNSS